MRYTYLTIDVLIILVPLLYCGDRRIRYYRCFPALSLSILIVGLPYIVWDVLATRWGEWSFNAQYVTGAHILNLPIEEVLFFVTVPFSCLFIHESVAYYTEGRRLRLPSVVFVMIALLLGAMALSARQHGYTMKALLACAIAILLALLIRRESIMDSRHWLWLGICFIPFLLVNFVLTALPVVEYNPDAILGPRVFTIPVEDFFYNFSMLSLYGLFYLVFKDWLAVSQGGRAHGSGSRDKAAVTSSSRSGGAERWSVR